MDETIVVEVKTVAGRGEGIRKWKKRNRKIYNKIIIDGENNDKTKESEFSTAE